MHTECNLSGPVYIHFRPSDIITPVSPQRLDFYLQGYNSYLRSYLVNGFQFGFSIHSLQANNSTSTNNLKSAQSFPSVIHAKIIKELQLGRFSGPYDVSPYDDYVVSPLGVREKKTPGEFRIIHNLSYPYDDTSVNAAVPRHCATVNYASIADAAKHVVEMGQHCFLAKTDVKSAFRIIPVHPDDRHLLGFRWQGLLYFDNCLPMGCSSSCRIFETFSTSLEWIISQRLHHVRVVHVLDDFLFIASSYDRCLHALNTFISICEDIGVPIAPDKTVGPEQSLPFVGIQLDTNDMTASLPLDKVHKFKQVISQFLLSSTVTLKQTQSLCGMLNFACGVIALARAFSRRLYDLGVGLSKPYYKVRVNKHVKQDLTVWRYFLDHYNGTTLLLDYKWLSCQDLQLYTDASTTIGFGGTFGDRWFHGTWSDTYIGSNIAILELYPICLALHLWAELLSNQCLTINSDNMSVVCVLNSFTSKEHTMMILLRRLALLTMQHNILIRAKHIPGSLNVITDFLSRNQVQKAKDNAPYLQDTATPIPDCWTLDRLLTAFPDFSKFQ